MGVYFTPECFLHEERSPQRRFEETTIGDNTAAGLLLRTRGIERAQQTDARTLRMASMAARLLPLLLLVTLAATATADVVSLTDITFTDKVKEQDTVWFIKFFAPWCGHCKKLAPTWDELGKALEGEDGVEVGLVDCTLQKKTCQSADIRSYPTLKIFYNGEDIKKYSGPRDLEALKKFAIDSAAELSNADDGEAATE